MTRTLILLVAAAAIASTVAGCAGRDSAPPNVPMGQITEAPPNPPISPDGTDPR